MSCLGQVLGGAGDEIQELGVRFGVGILIQDHVESIAETFDGGSLVREELGQFGEGDPVVSDVDAALGDEGIGRLEAAGLEGGGIAG